MPRILLIEDNEMNRDMLTRRLVRRGFDVISAADGQEGVVSAHHRQPDLILMDMSLPKLDGWEATRRLKLHDATCHIPIVALTAHAMTSDRKRAMEAGCDDYETKPVEIKRLLAKINSHLSASNGKGEAAPEISLADQ